MVSYKLISTYLSTLENRFLSLRPEKHKLIVLKLFLTYTQYSTSKILVLKGISHNIYLKKRIKVFKLKYIRRIPK